LKSSFSFSLLFYANQQKDKIGLFSKLAAKEHQQPFDLKAMELTADRSSLYVKSCRRFILGANQMFILSQS